MFHLLAVEEIWFERWSETTWRPFPTDANGLTLGEMAEQLARVYQARERLIDRERGDAWRRVCRFQDSKRNEYQLPLNGLLRHVGNHGIHHRAQALYFLKQWGRTVPGGLDYIVFRVARPNVGQEPQTLAAVRQFGFEVATGHVAEGGANGSDDCRRR